MQTTIDGQILTINNLPILITAYNRPDQLSRLLYELNSFGMDNLFIFVDGAAEDNQRDNYTRVKQVHLLAKDFASRNQGTRYLISDCHLGCYLGVKAAIDWFFSFNEFGIILEDDLSVSRKGIEFCYHLLLKYQDDFKIGSISMYRASGYDITSSSNTLTLSPFPSSWGWATWRNRWTRFANEIEPLKRNPINLPAFSHGGIFGIRRWNQVLEDLKRNSLDSWAYRWLFTHWLMGWGSIILPSNQVQNMGFDKRATHTKSGHSRDINNTIPIEAVEWPLRKICIKQKISVMSEIYNVRTLYKRMNDFLK